jgi:hypothetical protein
MVGIVYQGKDTIMKMKTKLFTALIVASCFAGSAQIQQQILPPTQFTTDPATGQPIPVADKLKHFDLNFPGGTPAEFIKAIDKQADMKVNVIIPPEFAKEEMPPLEVFAVTLPQLFEAGVVASTRFTNVLAQSNSRRVGPAQYASVKISQGFRTTDQPPTDNSIWNFFVERPPVLTDWDYQEPVNVRVYQLSNLLGSYSIEDITTAIKTTWEMLDSKTKPEMKFHAETKLLVAKGTEEQLRMIETVTQQLAMGIETATGRSPFQAIPLKPLPPTQLVQPPRNP